MAHISSNTINYLVLLLPMVWLFILSFSDCVSLVIGLVHITYNPKQQKKVGLTYISDLHCFSTKKLWNDNEIRQIYVEGISSQVKSG